MDLHELFLCCRKGDLEKIKYLVESKDVELNVRDKWDSTPLYYACLCGHFEVVKFLLEKGAKCEANTFDGERCLYGALNTEIRNLLKNYKVASAQLIRRDLYHEFLRRLLESGEYADVCFVVHGEEFYAHKCILSVRSEYFNDMLLNKWQGRNIIQIKNELVNPASFRAMLQYLYMGRLESHVDHIDDLILLTKQCKLRSLTARIEDIRNKSLFFQSTKPGTHVTTLTIEAPSDSVELSSDFSILIEEALPLELCNWISARELPFFPEEYAPFCDVIFEVDQHQFRCHKTFFCSRSEYIKTLLRDPLHEMNPEECCSTGTRIPIVKLRNINVAVFMYILSYIYQDYVDLDVDNAYDVLLAADLYLLPGLKRQCGTFMAKYLDTTNSCSLLRTARMFDLPRLEDQCYQFLAANIEQMIELEDFHEVVREDAGALTKREDVDSIDVIDNIRFHLTANSIDEAHDKLMLIDSLLEVLDLDA